MKHLVLAMIVVFCPTLPAYAQAVQMNPRASIQWLPLRGAESREAVLARVQAVLDGEQSGRPPGGRVGHKGSNMTKRHIIDHGPPRTARPARSLILPGVSRKPVVNLTTHASVGNEASVDDQ